MLRQASSRSQRSKGFKANHALQICVLVAVTIWLLYQVKHSHDKKEFEETGDSVVMKVEESHSQIFKFGRKDIRDAAGKDYAVEPRLEDDEKAAEEIEREVKQEEESEDGEGGEASDEMIDENDQEKAEEEAEVDSEEVTGTAEEERKDVKVEESVASDQQEHEEGSQEARERTFKADDASSAVKDGAKAMVLESETGEARNLDEAHSEDRERNDVKSEKAVDGSLAGLNNTDSSIVELTDVSKIDEFSTREKDELVSTTNLNTNVIATAEVSNRDDASNTDPTSAEVHNQTEAQTEPETTVSSNLMEAQGNASVIDRTTNVLTSQNEIYASADYQNASMEMQTSGQYQSSSEKTSKEQMDKSIDGLEESKDSSVSAKNENGYSTQGESSNASHNPAIENEGDARTALSALPINQTEIKSTEGDATE